MTEVRAVATLIAEQNRAPFIPCKASLWDAEQALAAIFCLNWVFLTFRGRKLLYHIRHERRSSAVQIFEYVPVSKLESSLFLLYHDLPPLFQATMCVCEYTATFSTLMLATSSQSYWVLRYT